MNYLLLCQLWQLLQNGVTSLLAETRLKICSRKFLKAQPNAERKGMLKTGHLFFVVNCMSTWTTSEQVYIHMYVIPCIIRDLRNPRWSIRRKKKWRKKEFFVHHFTKYYKLVIVPYPISMKEIHIAFLSYTLRKAYWAP